MNVQKIEQLLKKHKMLKTDGNTLKTPAVEVWQLAGGYTRITFEDGSTIEG